MRICAIPLHNQFISCLDPIGIIFVIISCLTYVIGFYFYKKGRKIPIHHSIWHVFVVVAALFMYLAILLHVKECKNL
jgi:hemolysin III